MALSGKDNLIGRQFGQMLGRKAVNGQAVVAAIHFGHSQADPVARLHIERLAQAAQQRGPCVERNRALREACHHVRREADVLRECIERRLRFGGYLFLVQHCGSCHCGLLG
ncbi:hypothetical protein D3C81_1811430 [compost metagenome]